MRRTAERMSRQSTLPIFLLNVPATWQTAAAQRMYLDEILRLGRFLVSLGGVAPSPAHLAQVMREHEATRAAQQVPGYACHGVGRSGQTRSCVNPRPTHGSAGQSCGPPVAPARAFPSPWSAVPCCGRPGHLRPDRKRRAAASLLDATETGQRTLPAPFDRRRLAEDPLMELVEAYSRIPDVFRRPNALLYD